MKRKLLILFLGTFLLVAQALAQQITVTGKVSSADGPVPGVSIRVKGTSVVAQTNSDGNYSIKAATNDVLVFSYVGYATVERSVGNSATINVSLAADAKGLNEVVVVGFGTQKKESLTGAITSVDVAKVFGNRPIADVGRGLQGAVPGLSVVVPSGEVGSDPIIKIRGQFGSVNGNSNPLLLVDNVELPSIQYVNPNDIENITILKDAASTAIYGSKAAFGVVLITTKKGAKTDGNKFSYSNNFVWQSPFKDLDIAGIDGLEYTLDAHENMKQVGPAGGFWRIDRTSFEKIKEWQAKYGGVVGNNDPVVYGRDWYWDGAQKFGYRIYDPVEAMVKDHGLSQIHNLGLNGKSGNTTYNLSIGYLGQEGMMKPAKHDDYKRFTPSLSLSTKVNDYLTVRGGVRYADATKRNPNSLNSGGFAADPWLYLYRWSRLFPIGVQENGQDIIDPAFSARMSNDQIRANKFLNLTLGTTVNITKAWNVEADYTYNTENDLRTSSVPYVQGRTTWYGVEALKDASGAQVYVDENGDVTNTGGMPAYQFPLTDHTVKADTYFSQNNFRSRRNTFNVLSNYNLDLNDHKIKFLVGANIIGFDYSSQYSTRGNLLNNDNPQYDFAVGTENSGGTANWDSQVGFFGRVNYAFKDKYLLEATLRRDASSKFPTRLKWQTFPGVSGGWIISNEDFLKDKTAVLSFAKLRASWGLIGDQSVSSALAIPVMGISKNSWLGAGGLPNFQLGTPGPFSQDVSWQNIEHMNLGVDLRFFNNKFGVTAEVFQRYTRDMIVAGEAMPATYGASTAPQSNLGDVRTRGWELNLDFNHQFDNGLRLSIDANLADAVSFITKGVDYKDAPENRMLATSYSTGQRFGDVYGFVTDRLYQKEDFVYDANGKFVQTNIIYNGNSRTTNKLAGSNPVYQTYFEDGNQTLLISPGDVKFVDLNGDGYIDAGDGTYGNLGDRTVIGNTTPRYQYGFRFGADYKGFDLSVFFQGVGERKIWGDGQLAIPGYYSKEGAMPQAIAKDYWKPDRTDAFYPRAWNLGGANEGYVMRRQSKYMLDMSYLKIKNITLGYNLPAALLKSIKLASARIYVSLENFITFDKLRGLPIDPEAISGNSILGSTSSNYNLGRTGTSNPAFKSASAGLQVGF
ncbi:SusC/RagA family TonB-linked outer membrane protein [Pedobacter africanus]|uniref:TonB-linked outer membrane protein, SusC/RagA family n=1 Tax=Pedobacter africanus TaxID=151894 RepID=A0A1W2B5R5_9SPHI|nr:TonB-dependent receptor [Pedobacter africanus]SMC68184.1 TonB-linked outer membrane protein, SusC/RagA family [Pedobacter africanus]